MACEPCDRKQFLLANSKGPIYHEGDHSVTWGVITTAPPVRSFSVRPSFFNDLVLKYNSKDFFRYTHPTNVYKVPTLLLSSEEHDEFASVRRVQSDQKEIVFSPKERSTWFNIFAESYDLIRTLYLKNPESLHVKMQGSWTPSFENGRKQTLKNFWHSIRNGGRNTIPHLIGVFETVPIKNPYLLPWALLNRPEWLLHAFVEYEHLVEERAESYRCRMLNSDWFGFASENSNFIDQPMYLGNDYYATSETYIRALLEIIERGPMWTLRRLLELCQEHSLQYSHIKNRLLGITVQPFTEEYSHDRA